ncbi:hypothetical protein C2E20_6087 [Micractinium conductrix]|uniref:Uncharacterized protein n=1 Tax=Micractinium conductrix TaxID=554055 RepID=A0A2P6V908_9CHLO|nr:hypothetical protein C2E20_6087 [Micractinium conductrix]|eukprot:PSC70577.1 hypothetical protein C2E20_6087 [Micractinium conductrix]
MSKLALPARRRQPLVVLSLLLNILLLGGSVLWWSGGGTAGVLQGTSVRVAGARTLPRAAGFAACERAQIDEQKMAEWGCKVFNKVCFDQENVLLHSGEKTPNSPNFTHDELFTVKPVPAYVLPGYEEPLGTPHFTPKCWDLNIRGPTPYDPADVWQPAEFTNCTVPVVWWVTYFSIFGDLFIGSSLALDSMLAEGALDRNVTLAPVSLGLDLPAFYQPLLDPYTRHRVVSFSSLSSREHLHTGQPRCFERAALCNMVGMYTGSPRHHWGELTPKTTARRAMQHFRREQPEEFVLHDKLAAAENGTVFRVAFMPRVGGLRIIRNLAAAVEECKQWKPPSDTRFTSVDCVLLPDGKPQNHVKLIAQMQNVHALVNTHGSGNNYAFFAREGSALVEILPWNFHGKGCTWADQYFSDWYETDHTVDTGYFRLVADKDHTFMGPYEKKGIGSSIAFGRDQDVALDFPTLAKALVKIARGELETNAHNDAERTFYMTREDICPGALQYQKEEKEKAEAARKAADAAAAVRTEEAEKGQEKQNRVFEEREQMERQEAEKEQQQKKEGGDGETAGQEAQQEDGAAAASAPEGDGEGKQQ